MTLGIQKLDVLCLFLKDPKENMTIRVGRKISEGHNKKCADDWPKIRSGQTVTLSESDPKGNIGPCNPVFKNLFKNVQHMQENRK